MEVGKEHLYTELREREGVMPGTAKLDGVRVSCFQHLNKWEPHNWRATDNDDYDRNKRKGTKNLRLSISYLASNKAFRSTPFQAR